MRVGSLFSGVGGFDLGLELAGHEIVWQVENDAYCRRVLAKHWPDVPCYGDIHDVGAHNLEEVDAICGGFPCQPVSVAGKQLAQDDERWLWPEFARVIRELRPKHCLVENVPGLLVRGLSDVLGDLAVLGYDAEWGCVSAASVGAPHLRRRVFVIAHAVRGELRHEPGRRNGPGGAGATLARYDGKKGDVADATGARREARRSDRVGVGDRPCGNEGLPTGPCRESGNVAYTTGEAPMRRVGEHGDVGWWATEPDVGRVAHGVPARVDRLRGLGNAIVPQVAEWIGRRLPSEEG
jgi:DNA (cytosine-5)-methyltransferase 1